MQTAGHRALGQRWAPWDPAAHTPSGGQRPRRTPILTPGGCGWVCPTSPARGCLLGTARCLTPRTPDPEHCSHWCPPCGSSEAHGRGRSRLMDFITRVIITRASLSPCAGGGGEYGRRTPSSVYISLTLTVSICPCLSLPMKPILCVRHCSKFWGHPGSYTDVFLTLSFWLRTHKMKRINK